MVRGKVLRQILRPGVKAMNKSQVLSESDLVATSTSTNHTPKKSLDLETEKPLEDATETGRGTGLVCVNNSDETKAKEQDKGSNSVESPEYESDSAASQAENPCSMHNSAAFWRPDQQGYRFSMRLPPRLELFQPRPQWFQPRPQRFQQSPQWFQHQPRCAPAFTTGPRSMYYPVPTLPVQHQQPVGVSSSRKYSSFSCAQPALKRPRPDSERSEENEDLTTETEASPDSACERQEIADVIPRQWEYTEYGRAHQKRPKGGVEFSVLSYNILAQQLLEDNSYLYTHCDEESVLDWEHRKGRLLAEMLAYKPDVLCLQEVEEEHYFDFFFPHFTEAGYSGRFQKRTGDKSDGCAIFVKSGNFEICDSFPIIYNRGDILDRDNVALIVKLKAVQDKDGKEAEVFIATTHLLFNPRRGDVKLAQLSVLLAELDGLASNHSDSSDSSKYSPVIICGDFNSEPHSDIYKFLVKGYLHYEGLLCRELSGQREKWPSRRDVYLTNQLLPPSMKITDQCQYVRNLEKRNIFVPDHISKGVHLAKRENWDPETKPASNYPDTAYEQASCSREVTCDSSVSTSDKSYLPSTESSSSASPSHKNVPNVSQGTGCLWHNMNLVSAHKHTIERLWHSSNEVTTQHQHASCTVDYIFYNVLRKRTHTKRGRVVTRDIEEDRLRLLGRYGLLSSREIDHLGGLPNCYLASDHLGLLVKFLLKYT